jgi:hypothetical protein
MPFAGGDTVEAVADVTGCVTPDSSDPFATVRW